ncbi:MAG: carboxypeptidase regulatory-like domain-containing protein [Vicinamibacterales bacterium]
MIRPLSGPVVPLSRARAPRLVATALGIACAAASACGAPPSAPTTRVTVAGLVRRAETAPDPGQPIAGALVSVLGGTNGGRSTTTGSDGRFVLTDIRPGSMTLRATAASFASVERLISVTGDQTENFDLPFLPPPSLVTRGRVMDALTGEPIGQVTIGGDGLTGALTDDAGMFQVSASSVVLGPREIHLSGAGAVPRVTGLRVPGPEAVVTLIDASFDLTAFDQMFRPAGLRRWVEAPALVLVDHVLSYEGLGASTMAVRDEPIGDGDLASLAADLTWALEGLTGGTFRAFASTATERAAPGSRIPVLRPDVITVTRVAGLTAATGYWGYTRWLTQGGVVTGGFIMLDRDFEQSGSRYLRSLRAHELGHALGYAHVTVRPSVMNSTARLEPTPFDLDGARLAFARPPGNRTPDADPVSTSVNAHAPRAWSAGIH